MMRAGLDVARINVSHGTRDDRKRRLELVRDAAREAGTLRRHARRPRADRRSASRAFATGKVQLEEGAAVRARYGARLRRRHDERGRRRLQGICPSDVSAGDMLLLNDGQIVLEVEKVERHANRHRGALGRRALRSQGRQSPGRRHLGRRADRQGPRGHPARAPSSGSIISRCPSRAMPPISRGAQPRCARPAARPASSPRSSATRRSTISPASSGHRCGDGGAR